ncbi:MAG: KH domain-containing protein [Thermomicrobiales bacterium]|nr:KH domain-containing protein [Thermomicrobiales bacterium]
MDLHGGTEERLHDPDLEGGYDEDGAPFDDEAGESYAAYDNGHEDDGAGPSLDAAERLRSLVAYLATNLVDDPDAVEVETRQRGGSVFVSLRVPEEELGKVIGRGGRIARAIRTALTITGSRYNVRASLDIED